MRSYNFIKLVTWPSGKAKVCKTFIPRFKSGRHLQKKQASDDACFFCIRRFPVGVHRKTEKWDQAQLSPTAPSRNRVRIRRRSSGKQGSRTKSGSAMA